MSEQEQGGTIQFVYANAVQAMAAPFDMQLRFGVNSSGSSGGLAWILQVALSPQLCKVLVVLLQQQLQGYETTFGEIPDLSERIQIEKTGPAPTTDAAAPIASEPPSGPPPSSPQE
jgi:hypothetical protein